jgi:hypothetical protein
MCFQTATCDSRPPGGQVTLMIRPENIRLESKVPDDAPAGSTLLQGTVRALTDSGALVQFTIDCGSNFALLASISKREYNQRLLLCGDRVHLAVAPGDVHVREE